MSLAWIILGGVALWALICLGRQADRTSKVQWRVTATLFAAACWGGAALLALRGSWLTASALAGAGVWLAVSSRQRDVPRRPVAPDTMSEAEARRTLGVSATADRAEIQAAYRRLMARAHPDSGGSQGLAERLNAARDRLLKG